MLEACSQFLAGGQILKIRGARGKAMAALGLLLALGVLGASASVEFKHHNNTEMAAVLQQVHNRWVLL